MNRITHRCFQQLMSATMVGRRRRIKKKNTDWNILKQYPKQRNLDQNINDSKSHIWNSFLENIISSIHLFKICPHVPVDIIRDFFNFRFFIRKSQSHQNLAKKMTHFTIQFCSIYLTHFINLNSLDIKNNMLPQHIQNPFWLYKFPSKHISVWYQK